MNKKNDHNPLNQDDNAEWEHYIKTGKELYKEEPRLEDINNKKSVVSRESEREVYIIQGSTAGIDHKTAEKLQKGMLPIDITIDLHGYTIEQAYNIVERTINSAYNNHQRL